MIEKIYVYLCPMCSSEYHELDDAYYCCAPSRELRYICPECADFWPTVKEAELCCPEEEEE